MKSSIISIVLLLFTFNLSLSATYPISQKPNTIQSESDMPLNNQLTINQTEPRIIEKNSPAEVKLAEPEIKVKKIVKKVITAYSSSRDETDSTPFITASNTRVRDGVVAANSLPFGSKIMIPEIFGNKVFVVEDRTHPRYGNRIDIWMPSKNLALQFGKVIAEVHILDN